MPRPTTRVLALLELLQSGGLHPVRDLAAQLQVDERTVRRYVDHLLELDVPVESVRGRYGGYRIGRGHRLPPLVLTDEEAVAVMTSLLLPGREAPGEEVPRRTAAAKLGRVLPPPLAERLDALVSAATTTAERPAPRTGPDPAVLLLIGQAVQERRPVELHYTDRAGRSADRTVLPWGLVAHGDHWYLTGPDSVSRALRVLRVDRITSPRIGTGRFEVPAGFDAPRQVLASLRRTPWAHDVEIRVRATPEAVRRRFPAAVAAVDPVPDGADGWLRVRLRAEHLDWVAAALAALDAPFRVERPDELRPEIAALARRLLRDAADEREGEQRTG